jgi:hypothetical protein
MCIFLGASFYVLELKDLQKLCQTHTHTGSVIRYVDKFGGCLIELQTAKL